MPNGTPNQNPFEGLRTIHLDVDEQGNVITPSETVHIPTEEPTYDPAKDQRPAFQKVQPNPTGPTIQAAPEPSLADRAKKVFTEGIPRYSDKTVYNPEYGQQQFLSPAELLTPQQKQQHPVFTGALESAGEMTSPANVAMIAATGGLGELPEAAQPIARALSAYFSADMLHNAYQQYPELKAAMDRGDMQESQRLAAKLFGTATMGVAAGAHAVTGTPAATEETPAQTEAKPNPFEGLRTYALDKESPFSNAELTPEHLLTQEVQYPLKKNHLVEVTNPEGTRHIEVAGFSPEDVMKQVKKQVPDFTDLQIHGNRPIEKGTGYSVPEEDRLPFKKGINTGGRSEDDIERHELGHALVGYQSGIENSGMIRHTYPGAPSNMAAGVVWDTNGLIDNNTGQYKEEKLPGLIRMLMGGIAADEVHNGVNRFDNHNFGIGEKTAGFLIKGSDGHMAYNLLRDYGMSDDEAVYTLHNAIDRAKEYLTHPIVSDMIKENVGRREADLSRQYHYSPERLQSMHEEIQRRMNNGQTDDNRAVSGEGFAGREANASGAEEARAGSNLERFGNVSQEVTGLREKSTGDENVDSIIKEAGAIPAGSMAGLSLYHDPKTGSTLAARPGETSLEQIKANLAKSRQSFGLVTAEVQPETDRVSTRVPTGKGATENPLEGEPLTIGREQVTANPSLSKKMSNEVKDYPGVNTPKEAKESEDVINHYIEHFKDNLRFLWNETSPKERQAWSKWYESANGLSSELSDKYGISKGQGSAVIATQSPQKDWDMNVSLARRIADIYHTKQDFVATPEMVKKGAEIVKNSRTPKAPKANAFLESRLNQIEGKKYSDLSSPLDKAIWVRLYDETYNPREYHKIDPGTGKNIDLSRKSDGTPAKVAWGSFPMIANGLSVLEDGSKENISKSLGGNHKVRNFYNNIVDPSNNVDVTIDTHAVAAGHLRPHSGNSPEVTKNFGGISHDNTGVQGTYPIHAEAYRQLAKELGVKTREIQSVTWEKIRHVFPDTFKTPENAKMVDNIWKMADNGTITKDQARQSILNLAKRAQMEAPEVKIQPRKPAMIPQGATAGLAGVL